MSESQVIATSKLTRSLLVLGFVFGHCRYTYAYLIFHLYRSLQIRYRHWLVQFVGGIQAGSVLLSHRSDQWLWMLSAPLLFLSSSLSDLFWWKCVATTITIPSACWLVIQTTEKHHWFWMLVISSILTLDMGLVDMLSFFRGYWAPECMTVAIIGLLCWR